MKIEPNEVENLPRQLKEYFNLLIVINFLQHPICKHDIKFGIVQMLSTFYENHTKDLYQHLQDFMMYIHIANYLVTIKILNWCAQNKKTASRFYNLDFIGQHYLRMYITLVKLILVARQSRIFSKRI
ncbi:unnamed protein product [Spirodela intermedia]|uniref:Uncharacterized protein n=1 Tax=Spirodela intermedia TaxID=51605 RepID=A0A7I8ITX0_SPIIN|nr:unnamed protein product [Spirodela intermedia]CAA6661325.1 unnamed protein product [Spirodela intermedia]